MRAKHLVSAFILSVVIRANGWNITEQKEDFLYFENQNDFLAYDVIPSSILHKCRCKGNEVLEGVKCSSFDTLVKVVNSDLTEIGIPTISFKEVITSELQCQTDRLKIVVDDPQAFYLHPTGEIGVNNWVETFSLSLYCLEHVFDDVGELSWLVELCIVPPNVPKCCDKNQVIDIFNWKCKGTDVIFDPPIIVGKSAVNFLANFTNLQEINGVVSPISDCGRVKTLNQVALLEQSSLYYTPEGAILLWFPPGSVDPVMVYQEDYCVAIEDTLHGLKYLARFCYLDQIQAYEKLCNGTVCINKCCLLGHHYLMENYSCVTSDNDLWPPQFYDSSTLLETSPPDTFEVIVGYPICKSNFFHLQPERADEDNFRLLNNGSLYIESYNGTTSGREYCIDFFNHDGQFFVESLLCFPDHSTGAATSNCPLQERIISILLLVSCFFLLITILVYAIIPDLHAKVHGKCLISHSASLFVAYLSLTIVQLASGMLTLFWCRTFAIMTQLSFLAAFFWLNVMCFDIWWTLRLMTPAKDSRENSKKRFVKYCIYAWGCPLIICSVTVVMNFLPESIDTSDLILPEFGKKRCWFSETKARWLYFYMFVVILTIANVILFLQVAYILIQAHISSSAILRTNSNIHKERIWIYLKLFFVMGVTWIAEVVSYPEGLCGAWIVTDIINASQGIFIFIIFICKRSMFTKIKIRALQTSARLSSISRSSKRTTIFSISSRSSASVKEERKETKEMKEISK